LSQLATVTKVGDSATNVTLAAARINRKGLAVYNTSTATLYLKLGATAVIADRYTVAIGTNAYWELPTESDGDVYRGIVDGIWGSDAGGHAFVTELTV
jgi:hypothetical protein